MSNNNSRDLLLKVPRDVITDLLPLYAAGEASAATRNFVDEYLRLAPEARVELEVISESLPGDGASAAVPAPELALRSLRRTRALLRWRQWAFAWALAFSVASLGGVGYLHDGHLAFHFFLWDYPKVFVPCASIALSLWINYLVFRWRLRT